MTSHPVTGDRRVGSAKTACDDDRLVPEETPDAPTPSVALARPCRLHGRRGDRSGRDRDRDHDHLPDKWEKRYHLSTKSKSGRRDADHDKLNNRREYKLRTNPRRKDTDRDKLRDYAEVKRYKTNPRRKDTDRDGLSDYAEVKKYKTNPRRKDTDKDGASDGQEVKAGTDPKTPRASRRAGPLPPTPGVSCAASTNVPGGRDPWGGCFPSAANTGVPDGTVLSNYGGPCTVTAANSVIDRAT